MVDLVLYSQTVYGLLDLAPAHSVASDNFPEKSKFESYPAEDCIIVPEKNSKSSFSWISGASVSFGSNVIQLDFLCIASVPYDSIIRRLTLIGMAVFIDICHQTVAIRKKGRIEVLNLVY